MCVLMFMDYFSIWVEVFPLMDHTANTAAPCLIKPVFGLFGLPLPIHSDQGSNSNEAIGDFSMFGRVIER